MAWSPSDVARVALAKRGACHRLPGGRRGTDEDDGSKGRSIAASFRYRQVAAERLLIFHESTVLSLPSFARETMIGRSLHKKLPMPGRRSEARDVAAAPATDGDTRGSSKVAFVFMLAFITPSVITLPFQSPRISALRGLLLLMFLPALVKFFRGLGRGERHLR